MSDTIHPSHLYVAPLPEGLKNRCVKAARRRNMSVVEWAIQMLTLSCDATEEAEANQPPPALPRTCDCGSDKGYLCTREPGHQGDHFAENQMGQILDTWPQKEVVCYPQ
jgi:hypothetical protein